MQSHFYVVEHPTKGILVDMRMGKPVFDKKKARYDGEVMRFYNRETATGLAKHWGGYTLRCYYLDRIFQAKKV